MFPIALNVISCADDPQRPFAVETGVNEAEATPEYVVNPVALGAVPQ